MAQQHAHPVAKLVAILHAQPLAIGLEPQAARMDQQIDRRTLGADGPDPGARGPEAERGVIGPALDLGLDDLRAPENRADRRRCRRIVKLGGRSHLHDPPRLHHRDPISNVERLLGIVRDQQRRRPALAQEQPAFAAQAAAQHDIDAGEGLVHQQHGRLGCHRAGERGALLLPARKLMRIAPAQPGQPHAHQPALDVRRIARRSWQTERDVLRNRHVRKQRAILEHEADRPPLGRGAVSGRCEPRIAEPDLARLQIEQPGCQAEQG